MQSGWEMEWKSERKCWQEGKEHKERKYALETVMLLNIGISTVRGD